jgi:hypothetical protein
MLDIQTNGSYRTTDDLLADRELLEQSDIFDATLYRLAAGLAAEQNAAEHYLIQGWREVHILPQGRCIVPGAPQQATATRDSLVLLASDDILRTCVVPYLDVHLSHHVTSGTWVVTYR